MATHNARIIISMPIHSDMVVFEGNPNVVLERQLSLAAGDEANVTALSLGVHTGTHVDAPLHFFERGAGIDLLSLEVMVGMANVVDARFLAGHIDEKGLKSLPIPRDSTRLLFKTRNSQLWDSSSFSKEFQGLSVDGAAYLLELGVSLVGWDYLSIGPFGDAAETHRGLLGAGVVILEGIDLRAVEPGEYELLCLPLRLQDCDGAPARAVLRTFA